MIKRPLLGMFLMLTAGVLLGQVLVPRLWTMCADGAGLLLSTGTALVVLAAGLCVFVFRRKWLPGKNSEPRKFFGAGQDSEPDRKVILRLLLAGAVLGLLRGGQQELQYQRAFQALETARQQEQSVYATGLITQVKQTETSFSYQLSHCTLQTAGASGSIPDLTIYQSTKNKYQSEQSGASFDVTQKPVYGYTAETSSESFKVGMYIILYGVPAELTEATNDGSYDEKSSYYTNGIVGKFFSPEMKPAEAPWYLALWGKVLVRLDRFVQCYQTAFRSSLAPENLGVLEAMCLGRKEHLSQELKDTFQNAGISHILAISGVHISILGMFLFQRIRKFRLPVGGSALLAILLSLLFAISTGSGTSALRAVVMFGVFLGSIFWGKSYDGLSSLAFAGMILLLAEPYCIRGASFQYSFAAVAGIFGVQELINCKYKRLHPLFSSFFVSLAAWLCTLPLTAWYQYRITTYSMLLNLLVLPLAAPILVGGLFGGGIKVLAGVLGGGALNGSIAGTGVLAGIFTGLGNGLLKMAELCIRLLRGLAAGYGKLPGGSLLVGKPHWMICVVFYLILLIIYIVTKNRKVFLYFAGIIPLILAMILGNQGFENKVVFLDVGQGDGIYLESADGRSYFIDGGSSSENQVGRYTMQPFLEYHARGHIDVWFVSHCDSDHISGLLELMENGYPIGRIVFARDIVQEETYQELVNLAGSQGIPISYMGEGDFLQTGQIRFTSLRGGESVSGSSDGVENRFGTDLELNEDPNDHCLVLLTEFATGGQTFLFAGDSSIEAEQEFLPFLQKQLAGRTLFLMKADHHGSKYSNGEALLQLAQPEVAVVSCSSTNLYGHPHPDAVNRIVQSGAEIFYTMKSGQVTIGIEKEKNWIMEFRKE